MRDLVLPLHDVLRTDGERAVAVDDHPLRRADKIQGRLTLALDAGERLAGLDEVSVRDKQFLAGLELERRVVHVPVGHPDAASAVLTLDHLDDPVDVADLGLALGHAGLEQLFDAGETGGDVEPGHAAGVEGPHRQLRARLADGLGGDDAHRLADLDEMPRGQVAAVAGTAHAVPRQAGKR